MSRLLVTGDRNWTDEKLIYDSINKLNLSDKIEVLIEGGAKGADSLAWVVTEKLGIEVIEVPAMWYIYKGAAGPIRNRKMMEYSPTICFAYHDEIHNSKGTKDMIKVCNSRGVPVILYSHKGVIENFIWV